MRSPMSANSVQRAHDELLTAMPAGASHDACPLCHPGDGDSSKVKEVAVADGDRTFTEAQHFALLTDAVARETASLSSKTEDLETKVSGLDSEKAALSATIAELQTRIDVLDAEKAAAEQARDAAVAEFTAHKDAEAEKAAATERRAERVTALKAANSSLQDEYFTEQRVQRWAEMSQEQFDSLLVDITEAAAMGPHKFVAKPGEADVCKACDKSEKAGMHGFAEKAVDGTEAVRETAAFKGGESPTAGSGVSLFGQFLTKTGHAPAAV